MKIELFPYRYADAVVFQYFDEAFEELKGIFLAAPVPLLNPAEPSPRRGGVKRRNRGKVRGEIGNRYTFFPVDQKALNSYLDEQFERAGGWEYHPLVTSGDAGPETGLKADFKKGALQVEVQFGNMARWYTDVFKFQLSYSQGRIDVAILVVPKQRFANLIDENVAHFERVTRELPWAKMSITLPILVIGVEPDDYAPIQECYDRAFETVRASEPEAVKVPFREALVSDDEPAE